MFFKSKIYKLVINYVYIITHTGKIINAVSSRFVLNQIQGKVISLFNLKSTKLLNNIEIRN
jgi:hypothetical protein